MISSSRISDPFATYHVAKLTEKAVVDQLNDHSESNELLPEEASAYRIKHSTETALIKDPSDMFAALLNLKSTCQITSDARSWHCI